MRSEPAPASPTDAELIARLRARERAALESLYDRYASRAFGIAYRVLRDRPEAEEVVQDVFFQLWNQALRYDERRGRLGTWLVVMTRNRAVDRLRSRAVRARATAPPDPSDDPAPPDPQAALLDGEQRRTVLAALAQLPGNQREAVELAFYRGLTHSEIAHATGDPIGTVKSRLGRAMAALRSVLAEST